MEHLVSGRSVHLFSTPASGLWILGVIIDVLLLENTDMIYIFVFSQFQVNIFSLNFSSKLNTSF